MAKKSYIGRSVRKQVHFCASVEGMLRSKEKITYMTHKGIRQTDAQARQRLMMARYEGKEVIPCSDDCYRFDYKKGCPGHIKSIKPNEELMKEIEKEYMVHLISKGEACLECGKEMSEMDTNYGTPEMAVCINCFSENQQFKT